MGYTKGEWKGEKIVRDWLIESPEGRIIATVNSLLNNEVESDANAHLITAAPDLYEKLLKVQKWLNILIRNAEHQLLTCRFITLRKALEADIKNYQATLSDINEAIAKVEGG